MRLPLTATAVFVGLLVGLSAAQAHPGHAHHGDLRFWKDVRGIGDIEASFMLFRDEQVKLCKHDGKIEWFSLNSFGPVDQAWVRNRVETIHRLNAQLSDNGEDAFPATRDSRHANHAGPVSLACGFALVTVVAFFCLAGFRIVAYYQLPPSTIAAATVFVVSCSFGIFVTAKPIDVAPPAIQKHFEPFKDKLELRYDDNYLYVGSNGLPDHPMMIGIKAWQQQVPLPQPYAGRNAWQIPLHPKLADKPISAKKALYRGAIALAVNGVPIFNALNNRGEDAYLAGELDEYGGHCGRGDDYHYHIAPVHLEKVFGKGNPIAYALDGFPLYGYTDAEGLEPKNLDEFNGRTEKDGYRYYATKTYPYINGGMRGVVTVRGDQIEPQPKDAPVRPAGQPLRGAKITDFIRDDAKKSYTIKYDVRGAEHSIKYTINNDGTFVFVFRDGAGKETTETYRRREQRPEGMGKDRRKRDDPPPRKDALADKPS